MRHGKNMRVALAAVMTAAALGPFGTALAQLETALVQVDAVQEEPLAQTAPVLGRFVARQAGDVAARSAGAVADVLVQVGDRVEAGQLLARLVSDSLEAELDLRKADLRQAEQELARLDNLRRSGSAAHQKARYDDAAQAVARAAASLRLAEIELSHAEITAPYPGVVTVRHTEKGAYLSVGQPVVSLINDRNLEIEADVSGDRVGGLDPGREVTVQLANGNTLSATVRSVVPQENPMTQTRAVRFTPAFVNGVPVGAERLAVNQSVTVHVPLGEARTVVSVHKDAIIHREGEAIVYVVRDGAAEIRPVDLGLAVGGRFEVRGGLIPGELVVVRGNERLQPGQSVRYEKDS